MCIRDRVQLFHIIVIYRIHAAKLIFSAYTRTFTPPDLSICQIVNISRTRLRHSGTKEGTDGNTRFSHGREEAGVSAFAFLGLLSDHRDIPSYAQVKGSRQRNRVFPWHHASPFLSSESHQSVSNRVSCTRLYVAFTPSVHRHAQFSEKSCGEKKCFFSQMKNESTEIDS